MRIRFFAYFYPPCIGGGEVILAHQAQELAARGHEVHVHCTPYTNINLSTRVDAGDTVEEGVHVHRRDSLVLPFHNPLEKDLVTPAFLREVFEPADLLCCVGYPSVHLDALLFRAKATNTPLVVNNYITRDYLGAFLDSADTTNQKIRSRYWRHVVRRELKRADLVIADSPKAADALRERLGLDNVACHIGMAVDPAEFEAVTDADLAAAREALGLGQERLILAPSRIAVQKGADLLVEAAGPLLGDDVRLAVCGPVNEPELYEKTLALAAPYGDRVVFGQLPRPQLLALMKSAEIVVLPSRGETVGGVVFEGMHAGALAIVSDAVEAASADYLEHEVNGLLFPSEDVPALRAALERALTTDVSEMVAAGQRTVEERFTWARSVDRLWDLYRNVLEAHGG